MVYLLLLFGLVFSVAIGAFLWGRFDPEVKAVNTKYEESLANKTRHDQKMISGKKSSNLKIEDNKPSSIQY
jgi:hypothetical protein|tara:strand:- start:1639 stop:1851 length:213 start_codon:yes stop_codon:yes gene_type:complete